MSRSPRRPIPATVPEPPDRPFRPADQILVIVILLIAAVLAMAGVPTATTLELLAGASAVAMRLVRPRSAQP